MSSELPTECDPNPLLIIDLDGVISPYGTTAHDDLRLVRAGGHRLLYRPAVIDELNRIHREGRISLRWLTTWGTDARTHVAPAVGLDDFPLLEALDLSLSARQWPKIEAVQRQVRIGRRFAWIDDDLTPAKQLQLRQRYGADGLPLRPRATVGLTLDELAAVRLHLGNR
ncbi:HAD domain-containing protein [Isoptericola croceus]|uniref:HAD domain-containing protein n=1 Tax=Isoptericola croceus TaxID=3031406 RepID=UPI0023F8C959|nr:hypothetical protein [Isoptericola croceus]